MSPSATQRMHSTHTCTHECTHVCVLCTVFLCPVATSYYIMLLCGWLCYSRACDYLRAATGQLTSHK